jgi:hypothetical protein
MQELAVGSLRPEPRRQLLRIAQQFKQTGEATIRARPELKPGTRLMREWQGRTYDVLVLDDSFSWQNTRHRSLSAIARKITARENAMYLELQTQNNQLMKANDALTSRLHVLGY